MIHSQPWFGRDKIYNLKGAGGHLFVIPSLSILLFNVVEGIPSRIAAPFLPDTFHPVFSSALSRFFLSISIQFFPFFSFLYPHYSPRT